MILGTKITSGQARCIFTDQTIPQGEKVVIVQVSKVQTRYASLAGIRQALTELTKNEETIKRAPQL
jgi:hypothetical protein